MKTLSNTANIRTDNHQMAKALIATFVTAAAALCSTATETVPIATLALAGKVEIAFTGAFNLFKGIFTNDN